MNIRPLRASFLVAVVTLSVSSTLPGLAQITINIPSIPTKVVNPTTSSSSYTSATNNSSSDDNDNTPSSKPKGCESNVVYQAWNEDIQKTVEDIRSFSPGRDYFVRDFNDNHNKYLKMALSESYRAKDMKDWQDEELKTCMNPRLDELAAIAAKVIGGYTPAGYTGGTPAEKAVLRTAVTDISNATVHSVGIKDPSWKIVYNDLGIPRGRKKLGKLWLKYPHNKYCTIVWANVWQPYAGGGTYGASERDFIAWEFAGCPAGK